jgi:CBS domain-containing protein
MAITATARDVYSQEFSTVLENDPASRCLEGFKKGMPPVLAVLDEKGLYVGMVSADLFYEQARSNPNKSKKLNVAAPAVSLGDSLSRISKLMIGSGVRQLPVIEKSRIIGFVTDEAVIHAVVDGSWGSGAVETIMTRAPYTIEANRSVGAVMGLMREYGVSHVPVMDKGRLVGIISIQDILNSIYFPPIRMGNQDVAGDQVDHLHYPPVES